RWNRADVPCRRCLVGASGCDPSGLAQRELDRPGETRSTTKANGLRAAGVDPVVVDVFDAQELSAAVLEAHPDIVGHQLTDLPPGLDPSQMTEGTQRNARMRSQGTQNLVAAALGAGVRRIVAQSIA